MRNGNGELIICPYVVDQPAGALVPAPANVAALELL